MALTSQHIRLFPVAAFIYLLKLLPLRAYICGALVFQILPVRQYVTAYAGGFSPPRKWLGSRACCVIHCRPFG